MSSSSSDLMMIGASLVWGINFCIVKLALGDLSPLSFNSVRFGLSSVLLLILLWVIERDITIHRKDIGRFFLLGLIGNTIYQLFFIN